MIKLIYASRCDIDGTTVNSYLTIIRDKTQFVVSSTYQNQTFVQNKKYSVSIQKGDNFGSFYVGSVFNQRDWLAMPLLPTNMWIIPTNKMDGENLLVSRSGTLDQVPIYTNYSCTLDQNGHILTAWPQRNPSQKWNFSDYVTFGKYYVPGNIRFTSEGTFSNRTSTWTLTSSSTSNDTFDIKIAMSPGGLRFDNRRGENNSYTFQFSPKSTETLDKALTEEQPFKTDITQYQAGTSQTHVKPNYSGFLVLFGVTLLSCLILSKIYTQYSIHKAENLKRKGPKGFTLVEVLVVVGILAILAGLLFPVLQKAQLRAHMGVAIGNVSQISKAIMLYQVDSDDRYPMHFVFHLDVRYYWPQLVVPYVQKNAVATGEEGIMITDEMPKLFFDPARPFKSQFATDNIFDHYCSWGLSTEITNVFDIGGKDLYIKGHAVALPPITSTEVVNPSSVLSLVESIDWNGQSGYPGDCAIQSYFDLSTPAIPELGFNTKEDIDTTYPSGVIRLNTNDEPDLDAVNVSAFCDGHVKALPVKEIISSPSLWSISGDNKSHRPVN